MDSHTDAERQGALAMGDVTVADAVRTVGGHPEGGVEPVEGLLGVPFGGRVVVVGVPIAVVEFVGKVGVAVGPGADLGVVGGQVSDGVAIGPVVGVELEGLSGQLALV
jgi:hypothetical protein